MKLKLPTAVSFSVRFQNLLKCLLLPLVGFVAASPASSQQTIYQFTAPDASATSLYTSSSPDSTQHWIVVFSSAVVNKRALVNAFEQDLLLAITTYYGSSKLTEMTVKPLSLINGAAFTAPSRILPSLLGHAYIGYIDHDYEVKINPAVTTVADHKHLPKQHSLSDGLTGKGVIIAIIDTGVDYTHPDLGGCFGVLCRVIGGYDTVDGDPDPIDENGHGTHVAGIAVGTGISSGVAQGAKILAYRALNAAGAGTMSSTIEAIERAVEDGAHIINMSLGAAGVSHDNPLNLAVREAVKRGVLVVASAGNNGPQWGTISSPGSEALALTVGALGANNGVARFSSRGPVRSSFSLKPDISAPGVGILSAVPGGGHNRLSGTSMAAPYVAGLAALVKEMSPQADVWSIRSRVIQSATAINQPYWHVGSGRANTDVFHYPQLSTHPTSIHVKVSDSEINGGLQVLDSTISVWNYGTIGKNIFITSDTPNGVNIWTQSISSVPASGKIELPVRIQIDPKILPYPTATPPVYWGSIQLVAGADTVVIPIVVARPSEIEFEFQGPPNLVVVHDRDGGFDFRGNPGRTFSMQTGAGLYDVWAIRDADATKWVFEGVAVEGTTKLNILETDAKNTLRYVLTDQSDNHVGACGYSREFLRHKPSNLGLTYQYERSCPEVPTQVIQNQLSSLSSDMLYEVSHIAYGAPTGYEYLRFPFRFENGIHGNMLLRKGGDDFRPLNWRYVVPTGVSEASFIRFYETSGGNTFNPPSWLSVILREPWIRTEHLTPNPSADFGPFHRQYDRIFALEGAQFDPDMDATLFVTPSVHMTQTDSLVLRLPESSQSRKWMIPYRGEELVLGVGPDSWGVGSMMLTDNEVKISTSNTWFMGWNRELRVGQVHLEIVDADGGSILNRTVKNDIPKTNSIHSNDWITQRLSEKDYWMNLIRSDTYIGSRQQTTMVSIPLKRSYVDSAQNCIDRFAILNADGHPIQVARNSSGVRIVIESRNCELMPILTIYHWSSQQSVKLTGTVSNRNKIRTISYSLPDGLSTGYLDIGVKIDDLNQILFEQLVSPALLITNGEQVSDPPTSPNLLTPTSRQFVFDSQVELVWKAMEDIHTYRIQLSLDGDFTQVVVDSLIELSTVRLPVYGYGQVWFWRVSAMNEEGWGPWSPRRSFTTVIEATTLEEGDLPIEWALFQNYLNPFNPTTTIRFSIGATEHVRLDIFSIAGHKIKSLDMGVLKPGNHAISIDLSRLASGLYLYQLSTPTYRQARKMTLVK